MAKCRAEYTASRPTQRATTGTLAAILLSGKKPLCINDRPLLADLVHLADQRDRSSGRQVPTRALASYTFVHLPAVVQDVAISRRGNLRCPRAVEILLLTMILIIADGFEGLRRIARR